jgi:hypothetical protein
MFAAGKFPKYFYLTFEDAPKNDLVIGEYRSDRQKSYIYNVQNFAPRELFNKAIHLFAPLNECIPVLVSIFKGIGISHDK